jgi:hypothetical protein
MSAKPRIYWDKAEVTRLMGPGWSYKWAWGGGGNYPTIGEATRAAYGARNDRLSRCPMCGGEFG